MLAEGRVLVVDDDAAIRALLAKIVERAGLPVDTAKDGSEAIEKLRVSDFAVVVLDLMMPRVSGREVIEFIRSLDGRRPAVIVASAGDPASLRQLDGAIVHSIVRKPFEIEILGELIAAAARTAGEERASEEAKVVSFPKPG